MNIIAYTYEADTHCIDCTKNRYHSGGFNNRYEEQHSINHGGQIDTNGVHVDIYDHEGNTVNPLFGIDEWMEFDSGHIEENPIQYLACGDCHAIIDNYEHIS